MHSALYHGVLSHRRELAPAHRFAYRMRLCWFDLDELPALFAASSGWSWQRFAPGWLRRQDYLRPDTASLKVAVCDEVAAQLGVRPNGPVRMLTAPRVWGIGFNPLTLYYCYDASGTHPQFVLAEVRNTPWLERHCYALDLRDAARRDNGKLQPADHAKAFHVSPFLPGDLRYHWQLSVPAEQLQVQIRNERAGHTVFRASLILQRETALSPAALRRELWRHWPQGLKTLLGIYWQAVRLLGKRAPFYSHSAVTGNPINAAIQTQTVAVQPSETSPALPISALALSPTPDRTATTSHTPPIATEPLT